MVSPSDLVLFADLCPEVIAGILRGIALTKGAAVLTGVAVIGEPDFKDGIIFNVQRCHSILHKGHQRPMTTVSHVSVTIAIGVRNYFLQISVESGSKSLKMC